MGLADVSLPIGIQEAFGSEVLEIPGWSLVCSLPVMRFKEIRVVSGAFTHSHHENQEKAKHVEIIFLRCLDRGSTPRSSTEKINITSESIITIGSLIYL